MLKKWCLSVVAVALIFNIAIGDIAVADSYVFSGTETLSSLYVPYTTGGITYDEVIVGTSADVTVSGKTHVSGGALTVNGKMTYGDTASLGTDEGTSGLLTVSGSTADLVHEGAYYIGYNGDGELVITDDAVARIDYLRIGVKSIGSGTVTLDGASFDSAAEISVGYEGQGSMSISGGSTVNGNHILIGNYEGSSGSLAVSEAAITLTGGIAVGNAGDGTMTVGDGVEIVMDGDLAIANYSLSQSVLNVSGSDTSITVGQGVYVGTGGDGEMNVSDGADISAGWFKMATNEGADSSFSISGEGSSLTVEKWIIAGAGATASFDILDGASVSSASFAIGKYNTSEPGNTDTVTVSGAGSSLSVDSAFDIASAAVIVADGATVEAGNLNLYDAYSVLEFDINELCVTDGFVIVDVGDLLRIDGGSLIINLADGYIPESGTVANLFDFARVQGTFDNIVLNVAPGITVNLDNLYVDGTIIFGSSSSAAVPEPGISALIVMGIFFIVFRKRSKEAA